MTSIIGSTPSAQPVAGVAAIVGAPSSEGAGVQDGDAVANFGALMGSLGQAPMGGQRLPTQPNGEPQDEAQEDSVEAAAPQLLQGAQDAVSQAMWPEAMVTGAQTQLAPETTNVRDLAESDDDNTELMPEADEAPEALQATPAGAPLPPTGDAEVDRRVMVQGDEVKVANTDVQVASQKAPARIESPASAKGNSSRDDSSAEPERLEEDGNRMMEWQRLAYGASFAPMQQQVDAKPSPSQEAEAQPQPGDGTNASDAVQHKAPPLTGAQLESQRTLQHADNVSQDQIAQEDDGSDMDARDTSTTVPRAADDDERPEPAQSLAKQPFFPAHMMPAAQAAAVQPAQQPSQEQNLGSPPSGQGDGFALSGRFHAQATERQRPVGVAEVDLTDVAASDNTEAGKAAEPNQAFHQALQGALPNQGLAETQNTQAVVQANPPIQSVAVSEELSRAISQGASRVQMRIVPEGLGELDIKVQMTGQNVHLTIRGDAPELAQLLSQKVQELRQDLGQQGLSLEAMDFGALASGNSSSGFAQEDRSRSSASRNSNDMSDGLQRLAGGATRQSGTATVRPNRMGPRDRIIDVIL